MSPGDRGSPGDKDGTETGHEGSTSSDEGDEPTTDEHVDDDSMESTDRSEQNAQVGDQRQPPSGRPESASLWTRFRTAETGPLLFLREVTISVGFVFVLGLLLFGVSGVYPPMVAVESESMEPNIDQYDLILVTEPGRFAPDTADETGVVTAESVSEGGYESFNNPGSVIVYDDPNSYGSPIIHRAHFFVEENENWYDRANPDYVSAENCDELQYCPAPHAGYITKGDNQVSNGQYDQANGIAPVVRPGWITGIAKLRVPYLGYVRLALTGAASFGPLFPAGLGAIGVGGSYAIGRRDLLSA